MSASTYAAWILVLQVVAYLGYLDFGLQTAVGRYIAFADAKQDPDMRDGIFSTALVGLTLAAVAGSILIVLAAACIHLLFPALAISLIPEMRLAVLVVGLSVAAGLPASACNGVFVGIQRYEIPALSTGLGKIVSTLGLIGAVLTGHSIVWMAWVLAVCNVLTYCLQWAMLRHYARAVRLRIALVTGKTIRELAGYCFSLTVWSFTMLLVSGLDVMLVGRFQIAAVVPYSVSATLIALLSGIQFAVSSVIMPHAATLQANENARALGHLVVRATKLGVLVLLVTGLPLMVLAAPLIRLWIGGQFTATGAGVLVLLVIANMIRLTGAPYASILVGSGQQRLIVVGPLIEGLTNLTASILLGWKYGAFGVAAGTLVGSCAGFTANILYSMAKTSVCIDVSRLHYLREAIAAPAACGLPVFAALAARAFGVSLDARIPLAGLALSLLASVLYLFAATRRHTSTRPADNPSAKIAAEA